ncbi:MAG: UDP-N-acetylmuramate dehydrogenase [Buchnera aphidicola (Meitanaphis elongallis)]
MIYKNQSLKKFHTFNIDVCAKKIVIIKNINALTKTWKICKKKIPFLFLGKGSNTLFYKNYNGIVAINEIKGIKVVETKKKWLIHVKGGVEWQYLITYMLKIGIYGLENLACIPGTTGAAAIQNIGAYGLEFKDVCDYVEVLSLTSTKTIKIKAKHCMFKYRNSIFKNANYYNYVILSVGIKLPKKWSPNVTHLSLKKINYKNITAHEIFNYIKHIRTTKLPNPKIIGNAGSFFKNPIINENHAKQLLSKYKNLPYYPELNGNVKISGGWLIEQCQLKGHSIGGAQVYENQALILINKYNATTQDVLELAKIIQTRIKNTFNIFLELEAKIIKSNN